MKTIRFLAVMLACIATSAFAQTPTNIQAAFSSKYPNATIKKLKQKGDNYIASFTNNGKKCKAYFTDNGKWVKTEIEMKLKTLPDAVRTGLVKSDYSRWMVEDAKQIDTPDGALYSVEVDNEYTLSGDRQPAFEKICKVYFTPAGSIVKEVDITSSL